MASSPIIYRHPTHHNVPIPDYDLLTFLFDSEHATASPDSILHLEAANPDNAITTVQLRELTERISHGLRHQYGIGASGAGKDVVTVITYGQILAPALLFGIIGAGGVYSAASPSSTTAELSRQVKIGRSSWIVCGIEHRDVAIAAAREQGLSLRNVLILDSTAGAWRLDSLADDVRLLAGESNESNRLPWPRITDKSVLADSLIILLWSSGTTGLPKGVKLSHRNIVAETFILFVRTREMLVAGTLVSPLAEGEQACTLAHLPIAHISGVGSYMVLAMYNNARVVWMRQYTFDELLNQLRRHRITSWYTVPSIWLRLTKTPAARGLLKHLVGVSTGAAAMDGALMRAVNDLVASSPSASSASSPSATEPAQIGQTWGLSETTGAVTSRDPEESDDTGSISSILPTMELRLVDESGQDIADPSNTPGELLVRGPVVTRGYFGDEASTKAAFVDDWFCSGDVAVRRDGKFYIVDRKKELLKYKGLQVAPAELENVLFQHPGIREAAVVGVPAPDDPATDWPRAYVVRTSPSPSSSSDGSGNPLTEDEVRAYIAKRLAPYKQLRGGVVFVDEIPKNAVGKFLRRELRERAKKEMAASGNGHNYSKL